MNVPISVIFMLIVVIAVVSVFAFNYLGIYPGNPNSVLPVSANFPTGEVVYKVGSSYYIPIRFSMATDKPIGVCKISISYVDKSTGNTYTSSVVLAYTSTNYRTSASFSDGVLELPVPVIQHPVTTRLTITFNSNNYQILSITFYYCEYGVSITPKWSETLLIPETVLSP